MRPDRFQTSCAQGRCVDGCVTSQGCWTAGTAPGWPVSSMLSWEAVLLPGAGGEELSEGAAGIPPEKSIPHLPP